MGPAEQGGEVYYLHGDHLGSTSLATSEAGEELYRRGYYPFGEERYGTGAAQTDYGFTGQREEAYIDLIEMGARWYDSSLGRWLTADSIVPNPANPQSLNRHAYVINNPLRYTDPTGHFERDEIIQILINNRIVVDGGTEEEWADWATNVVDDWEINHTEWWEMLRAAEVGDVLDARDNWGTGGNDDRWIGMFYRSHHDDNTILFGYRRFTSDGHWERPADELLEVLPFKGGLAEFYDGGEREDVILSRVDNNGNCTPWAGTGIYYSPHLGHDSPRMSTPDPRLWGDWFLGWLWLLGGTIPFGQIKGLDMIDRYLWQKEAALRLSAYYE